jgi:hypothetical protein
VDLPKTPAAFTTVLGQRPSLSAEIPRRCEDMVNRALRVTSTRMPSAATIMVEKPGVIRRAVAPASAAEGRTAVSAVEEAMEADITNRNFEPSRETCGI